MNIDSIKQIQLDGRTKGFPGNASAMPLGDVGNQGWNVLREDLPLPLLVLKKSALLHNATIFQEYCQRENVLLAPHGKTTMCPQIFDVQIQHGAWGITASTVNQLRTYRHYGVQNILLANQLVGRQHIAYIVGELVRDPDFDFMGLVDSLDQLHHITAILDTLEVTRPVKLLVEIGEDGGRTGCRNLDEARRIVAAIGESPDSVILAGIEGYEGMLTRTDDVRDFLEKVAGFVETLSDDDFRHVDTITMSAGGSTYFDMVVAAFSKIEVSKPVQTLIRSGCYITHDSGVYKILHQDAASRPGWPEPLTPALEIWSYVQSVPEPGLAFLTMGKRDCPYDEGNPIPAKQYRPGGGFLDTDLSGVEITSTNDQHAFLSFPDGLDLRVGDMIACGISHPCTAFDKWDVIPVVDDDYDVVDTYKTFF